MMDIPIPRLSAVAWQKQKARTPQNPGLIFDRFLPALGGESGEGKEAKKKALQEVGQVALKVDTTLLEAWNGRWECMVRDAGAEPFTLKTDWRLITGLGAKGTLEVGFTFHRYGFPILPGSSVKGVARAWALSSLAQTLGTNKLGAFAALLGMGDDIKYEEAFRKAYPGVSEAVWARAAQFRQVFGTVGASGCAVFYEAIPCKVPVLEVDVMNPHYPMYYQGRQPPSNWQSPVPVYFLTVAAGTEFRFAVGWRGRLDEEGRRLRDLAERWLVHGLTELGAGAKTTAGYGYFAVGARS